MHNNYGLNLAKELAERQDSDYVFGAFSPDCIADIPEGQRKKYLPKGELQNIGGEKMDCASRAPINLLETKFNWLYQNDKFTYPTNKKWLRDKDYVNEKGEVEFSDAFIAIKSGTTRQGNSLKAPCHAIHEHGLIPKKMLPQGGTFEEHHNPARITKAMEDLGKEFLARFPIHYEKVNTVHFAELYKQDMLVLAGYAWPTPVNGVYPRVPYQPNHAFMGIERPLHEVFDNYLDEYKDNDFIKTLAPDYAFIDYGYRLYVTENKPKNSDLFESDLAMGSWGKEVYKLQVFLEEYGYGDFVPLAAYGQKTFQAVHLFQMDNGVDLQMGGVGRFGPKTRAVANRIIMDNQKIYDTAFDLLGFDVTPNDVVADEVACAEVVCEILKRAGFPIGNLPLTTDLYKALIKDKGWAPSTPIPGAIVISPTGHGNGTMRGHVGIVGKDGLIMSNSSKDGIFRANYTIQSWHDRYVKQGAFPMLYFRRT